MVDKATRARLKEKAQIAKVKKALTTTATIWHKQRVIGIPLCNCTLGQNDGFTLFDDKVTCEKCKLLMSQSKAKKALTAGLEPKATSDKPPKMRRCCESAKGQGPHLPECPSLQPKKPILCFACSRDARLKKKERLPDGSRFHLTFDEKIGKWRGSLTLPIDCEPEYVFTGDSDGVFRLLSQLDEEYRKSLDTDATKD